jgi:hypothetical protein
MKISFLYFSHQYFQKRTDKIDLFFIFKFFYVCGLIIVKSIIAINIFKKTKDYVHLSLKLPLCTTIFF